VTLFHIHKLARLQSLRVLAHLRAREYTQAVQDASVSINVWAGMEQQIGASSSASAAAATGSFVFPTPAWYLPTLIRRSSCHAFLGHWSAAILDFEAALKRWNGNGAAGQCGGGEEERRMVQADLERIREFAAQHPQTTASALSGEPGASQESRGAP
jgi:hypothetical protein